MNWPTVPFFCAISVGVSLELRWTQCAWYLRTSNTWMMDSLTIRTLGVSVLATTQRLSPPRRAERCVAGGWMDGWFQICFVAVRLPTLEIYLVRKGVKRQPMTCWFWNPPGCHRGQSLPEEFIPDGDLLPLPHTRTQLCHYALRLTQPVQLGWRQWRCWRIWSHQLLCSIHLGKL